MGKFWTVRPRGRRTQFLPKIPFKEIAPLALRNEVSGKGSKGADVTCLQEMAVMFACMKNNDFKEVKCSPEIETFMTCYNQHTADKTLQKKRELSGEVVVGRNPRNLTTTQINGLLQRFPQFNNKR